MIAWTEEIVDVVQAVSTALLGTEAALAHAEKGHCAFEPRDVLAGCVTIDGPWRGAVVIACSRILAYRTAAQMFGCSLEQLTDEQARDAMGEIVNVVGGNLKSLFASYEKGPCHLSLPIVGDQSISIAGTKPIHCLHFKLGADVLRVTVLESGLTHNTEAE
ncbi:MAG: chemotaxis protein CheX [Myxococcales bacterium]|nr:chemotaxis protein CheX [Myxococcales bacterium]MCB9582767.1 chemotaxis protein CheX [Polyangiaceae bacterium]